MADALILLTGASGFVGPHVVTALREAGYRLRLAQRRPGANLEGVENFNVAIQRQRKHLVGTLRLMFVPALNGARNARAHLIDRLIQRESGKSNGADECERNAQPIGKRFSAEQQQRITEHCA